MRPTRDAAAVILGSIALAVAGCSAGGPTPNTQASVRPVTSQSASTPPAGGSVAGCSEWDGQEGVVRVFCDGPGTATVSISGKQTILKGGSCESTGSFFAFNLGVVTSDFPSGKTKPNYVGMIYDTSSKSAQAFVMTVDGETELMLTSKATLAADGKSAHASGKSANGKAVSADIACG